MNQTEIRKEPRDCFAVLQLFPEPYRQKVRTALESAGGRDVPDRQPLSIGGVSHSRQRYTCGLQEIRFRIGRPVLFYIDGEEWFATEDGSLQKKLQPTLQWIASRKEILQIIQHICRYSMYAYEEELGKAIVETLANFQYDEKYRRFNQKYNPLESIDCAKRTVELCIPPKRKESSV